MGPDFEQIAGRLIHLDLSEPVVPQVLSLIFISRQYSTLACPDAQVPRTEVKTVDRRVNTESRRQADSPRTNIRIKPTYHRSYYNLVHESMVQKIHKMVCTAIGSEAERVQHTSNSALARNRWASDCSR